MRIELSISGEPKPQPRPRARAFCANGKWIAQVYDGGEAKGWKRMIECAIRPQLPREPIDCPVTITATFFFERPQSHYGTGRNSGTLRPNAPTKHTQRPDGDNLFKALTDAITDAGLWRDDALIADAHIAKRWAMKHPGVVIVIEWQEAAQLEFAEATGAAA